MNKIEEEFWKLAQEMLAQKDFSRIKELEELNEQHRKLNGELRQENKQLQENFEKAHEEYWKASDIELELFARIDKAIEILESYSRDEWDDVKHIDEAIEILKGDNDE